MSAKRRIVVFQFRCSEESRLMEQRAFIRSTGLQADDFSFIDVMTQAPSFKVTRDSRGIILGGSPLSVDEVPHRVQLKQCLSIARFLNQAVLGVCFGAQLIADMFGGSVRHDPHTKEFGTFEITLTAQGMMSMLFADLPQVFDAQCAHHDRIVAIPVGAEVLASSARCFVQAFGFPEQNMYGVQFHPERNRVEQELRLMQFSTNAPIRESPLAEQVMKNFVQQVL